MLTTYATGLLALATLAVAWVAVDRAWRRTFPDLASDPDRSGPPGPGSGGCTTGCGRSGACAGAAEEDA